MENGPDRVRARTAGKTGNVVCVNARAEDDACPMQHVHHAAPLSAQLTVLGGWRAHARVGGAIQIKLKLDKTEADKVADRNRSQLLAFLNSSL